MAARAPSLTAKPNATEAIATIRRAVRAIPRGATASYGEVARRAGLPGRARLVGYVLRTAPAKPALPWFRVTGANGRIAFPRGSRLHAEQTRRLRLEGVRVEHGRAITPRPDLDEMLWKP